VALMIGLVALLVGLILVVETAGLLRMKRDQSDGT
jgi:hypothetical protein